MTGVVCSLLFSLLSPWPSQAADRLELSIDDVVLPIAVQDLRAWVSSGDRKRTELSTWLQLLDAESREGVIRLLRAPVLTRRSFGQQLLRSWAAGPLLDAIGDLVRLTDGDPISSDAVLATLDELLKERSSVSTIDLLEALPGEQLRLDLDALLGAAARWRSQLERHQALMADLGQRQAHPLPASRSVPEDRAFAQTVRWPVPHRPHPLRLQLWRPAGPKDARLWVVLMPGLGGSPDHLEWLAQRVADSGRSVALLDHPGSDAAAVQALLEGRQPFDGAAALQQRLLDLDAVLRAQSQQRIPLPGDEVVLIGHSLGALTAFVATGLPSDPQVAQRCTQLLADLPLTNLSRLLQCELVERKVLESSDLLVDVAGVVGLNSLGGVIWPSAGTTPLGQPLLLLGGTLDLITPPLDEQIALLPALSRHPASQVVVIEGASHFSPIRVTGTSSLKPEDDLFQLGEELVGVHPRRVQEVMAEEITSFLDALGPSHSLRPEGAFSRDGVRWHRIGPTAADRLDRRYQ